MAKRNRPPRRPTGAKPRPPQANPAPVPAPVPASGDQEAVDGILVQVKKTDLSIAGEQPGQVQKLPGYEVCVAIPEWDKNRSLLDPVRKTHLAQQKLLARLQGEGVSRPWMIERFNEVDKALAATLATVAERIRTRRWREKERGEALQRLQAAFAEMQRWTAKTTRYCQRAEQCADPIEKETVLDAACLGILKIGELINRVERMQHGFWQDFSAAHFLDMRHKRNLIGHTDELEGEDVVPLGTGIIQDLHTALGRTLFPEKAGPDQRGFLMSTKVLRDLEPTRPGDAPTPDNSIAMVGLDENNRFVITRVGRSEENTMMISSSVTGSMNLSVYAVRGDPTARPPVPDEQG